MKDINEAFVELRRMVCMHTTQEERSHTKLTVLKEAVRVIQDLETRVKGRVLIDILTGLFQ